MALKTKIELKTITRLVAVAVFLLSAAAVVASAFYVLNVIDQMSKPAVPDSQLKLHIERPNAALLQQIDSEVAARATRQPRDLSAVRDAFNMPPVPPSPPAQPGVPATADGKPVP